MSIRINRRRPRGLCTSMKYPDFADSFNSYYDLYSIHEADFVMPSHFNSYVPDNQDDYLCVNVICPSVSKGASIWTINEQWITIGIYKDEGRQPAQRQSRNGTWVGFGSSATITDSNGHKLHSGDSINVYSETIFGSYIVTVISPTQFLINNTIIGSGSLSYQDNFLTNFSETHRVFRLLPSFTLIPYSSILDIFSITAPSQITNLKKTLYNITTGNNENIPQQLTNSTNYFVSTSTLPNIEKVGIDRRFGQLFDSLGNPLEIKYLTNGFPTVVNNIDSVHKNSQISRSSSSISDFYGIPINDITRGPYYSISNIVIDPTNISEVGNIINNINYVGSLSDIFGNLMIGFQFTSGIVVRKQILPLSLNMFNQPIKLPS